ncbi:MAG: glycosyltransferase [Anaerolineales bacterium]|jgi:glycosyltransferase involved in cell wall biosynthesis
MKVLFLSRWYPYPPSNGSKLRIYNLIRGLANQHQVTLISFTDPGEGPPDRSGLQPFCQQIYTVPWKTFNPTETASKLGFFNLTPRMVQETYSSDIERLIQEELTRQRYDAVVASQFDMAMYASLFGNVPALYEEAELGTYYDQYTRAASPGARLRYWLTWWKHKRYLRLLLGAYAACTVVSADEQRMLQRVYPDYEEITILPNCVDVPAYEAVSGKPEANTMVFTGSFNYQPNYEAMYWFTDQVMPKVTAEIPSARVRITGDHAGQHLPNSNQVELLGFVDDIKPVVADAWISLAPIHQGGGTRLKILEAMALHTPVISTTKGAEGLDARHGEHLLIADTPEAFSQACVRLLKDRKLRDELAHNAFALVKTRYNWQAVIPDFLNLMNKISQN